MASGDRHTGRTVALIGGAAVVAWLLWRRKGAGIGGLSGSTSATSAIGSPNPAKVPCRVWVRADRIELEGAPADLVTVVARCRESGRADVRATGDAITRSIIEVLHALRTAGVVVYAPPDLAHLTARTPGAPA